MSIYKKITKSNKKSQKTTGCKANNTLQPSCTQYENIYSTIDENFGFINSILGTGIGLIERKYSISEGKFQAGLVYIGSITDKKLVSDQIIEPLLKANIDDKSSINDIFLLIQSRIIYVPVAKESNQMKEIINGLLNGGTILFINGISSALIIESGKVEKRAVEKPINEVSVLASKDSLTEDLDTNCNLIINRLPIPDLHFEKFTVGKLSQTKVKLLWIEGIANTKAIEEVRKRIQNINIDMVDGAGVLAELIQDTPMSIFATYRQSERPDVLAKGLSDGQFVILCSNSPFGLVAPITFWDNIKIMDDYAEIPVTAWILRLTRFIAFILAVTVSPLYLAFVTYNHTVVPPPLAINIAVGRDGVPFPSFVEILVMSFSVTMIREASLRIPGSAGYFVGTLAAIVIGQAAVNAGYISASVIIIVAVSTISAYAVSSSTMLYTTRHINYCLIILSGLFGMFGIINGIVVLAWHMLSLESFGVPYFYPIIPFDSDGAKDTVIRAPFSVLKKRMRILAPFNRVRMKDKSK